EVGFAVPKGFVDTRPLCPRREKCSYPVFTSYSKGRAHEAFVRRDDALRTRVHARSMSARAAAELPPGPLGVPARSWLTLVGIRPPEKTRAAVAQTLRNRMRA